MPRSEMCDSADVRFQHAEGFVAMASFPPSASGALKNPLTCTNHSTSVVIQPQGLQKKKPFLSCSKKHGVGVEGGKNGSQQPELY